MIRNHDPFQRILVLGRGLLGAEVKRYFSDKPHVWSGGTSFCDIRNLDVICDVVGRLSPDAIINCAAKTNVDACEDEVEDAIAVNAYGPMNVAFAAKGAGIPLIHISTDYVFDGTTTVPYRESDPPNPVSVYGHSKLEGERRASFVYPQTCVLRVGWLYGEFGHSAVERIVDGLRNGNPMALFADQIGTPTPTYYVAQAIRLALEKGLSGLFHVAPMGHCSRLKMGEAIRDAICKEKIPLPVSRLATAQLKAARPAFSALNGEGFRIATGAEAMNRTWKSLLWEYLPL